MPEDYIRRQSPIFVKTGDFMLWLLQHTEKFPKSERFRLARRIEDSAFAFHELLLQAARSKQPRRILLAADLELDKLRFYLRLAHDRKLSTYQQNHYVSGMLTEIGRLLGGWLKTAVE